MSIPFCIYKTDTGDVVGTGSTSSLEGLLPKSDESVYAGTVDMRTHVIDPNTQAPKGKPTLGLTVTKTVIKVHEEVKITGIPTGTLVGLDRPPRTEVIGGEIDFDSDSAGFFDVNFEHDDCCPETITFEVKE